MTRYSYATLEQVREELRAESDDLTNDPQAQTYLLQATQRIEQYKGYPFAPRADWFNGTDDWNVATGDQAFDHYSGRLLLPAPLLSITSVTETDGSSLTVWDGTRAAFTTCDVLAIPMSGGPIYALQRMDGSGNPRRWGVDGGLLITVSGAWGYHQRYSSAYVSSGDTLAAEVNNSASQFTVSDIAGVDAEGQSPRFAAGQIIKVDSELCVVTDTENGVLAVLRGQLGTTAASHLISATISVWKPDPNIVRATVRLAAYLFKKRAQFFDSEFNVALGISRKLPPDLPEEVASILNSFPLYGARAMVRGI